MVKMLGFFFFFHLYINGPVSSHTQWMVYSGCPSVITSVSMPLSSFLGVNLLLLSPCFFSVD